MKYERSFGFDVLTCEVQEGRRIVEVKDTGNDMVGIYYSKKILKTTIRRNLFLCVGNKND